MILQQQISYFSNSCPRTDQQTLMSLALVIIDGERGWKVEKVLISGLLLASVLLQLKLVHFKK